MKIDTGRFLITNAHSGNLAILSDANEGTDLVGAIPSIDEDLRGEKVRCSFIFYVASDVCLT